jgi:hypothetical protein
MAATARSPIYGLRDVARLPEPCPACRRAVAGFAVLKSQYFESVAASGAAGSNAPTRSYSSPGVSPRLPATIKNAIDYLHRKWQDRLAGFVSYGGGAAGTRALQQSQQVVATLKMVLGG